jgi:hypothetical protein
MNISSRTPEGDPHRCPICGNDLRLEPSQPSGDAPCPSCGSLLWFPAAMLSPPTVPSPRPASVEPDGQLIPVGKGESIRLSRAVLTIGRRESCDIRFPYPNLSQLHAELTFRAGCWYIRDLNSTNGVMVNDVRVSAKRLHSGDVITIAKRRYTLECAATID